jgi:hypothetical protein
VNHDPRPNDLADGYSVDGAGPVVRGRWGAGARAIADQRVSWAYRIPFFTTEIPNHMIAFIFPFICYHLLTCKQLNDNLDASR